LHAQEGKTKRTLKKWEEFWERLLGSGIASRRKDMKMREKKGDKKKNTKGKGSRVTTYIGKKKTEEKGRKKEGRLRVP